MKSFGKWGISIIWIIPIIIFILCLTFLALPYSGYYWDNNSDLPTNINQIHTFSGSGFKLIQQLGFPTFLKLANTGTFAWGYNATFVFDGKTYNILEWAQSHSNEGGVIDWLDMELTTGLNFAALVGGLLTGIIIAVPVLVLVAIWVTIKLHRAMICQHSIEYIDAKNSLKKANKESKKDIKKAKKTFKKGIINKEKLIDVEKYWAEIIIERNNIFIREKAFYEEQYNDKKLLLKTKK
ncbi:hypothetical protein [Spiroplasma chrysopicola]|uniref:Transmembrane protein n=1 Tax=Spiroplasma chrysopicola DF-1 TaxID=1276227 RepID=R4UFI6_9MOLU|nr:hypothetical protein [Spiroplasma chrysopicola]AGM24920.1 hypothetical protein SCHRY_v1c03350 [Spiroplasma chrysopicola DF-1]